MQKRTKTEQEEVPKRGSNPVKTVSAAPHDENEGNTEHDPRPSVQRVKRSTTASPTTTCSQVCPARSYSESVLWGGEVELDGRIAAAIHDMASAHRQPSARTSASHSIFVRPLFASSQQLAGICYPAANPKRCDSTCRPRSPGHFWLCRNRKRQNPGVRCACLAEGSDRGWKRGG
jgi:hypothetical protein